VLDFADTPLTLRVYVLVATHVVLTSLHAATAAELTVELGLETAPVRVPK